MEFIRKLLNNNNFVLLLSIFCTLLLASITRHYILVLLVASIFITANYRKWRGYFGEFWVKRELKKLPPDKYKVLNNVMIKTDRTCQIDHLVISPYGIFAIEMKNFYGYISGDVYSDQWVQSFGKKNKYRFKNPTHQNYGHIKSLESALNIDEKYFISIICFSNQATLAPNLKNSVVQLDYLVSKIQSYTDVILTQDLDEIYNKIVELNIVDPQERKEHIQNIKMKKRDDREKVRNMICPKCGGELVVRQGKYGRFIGCSNFPDCRYIKK